MKRFYDWPERLDAAVRGRLRMPFAYGQHDCCMAAADLIHAVTGVDPMKAYRGQYHSAASAVRLFHSAGHSSLVTAVDSALTAHGAHTIQVLQASIGDLVIAQTALPDALGSDACGIAVGERALFPSDVGWISLPVRQAHTAYRIGHQHG
ncbi:hypothetical protein GCM10017044_10960 [Kordiimonas sediminis]|uniref:DUF6950 domain-containing protein n=1 Tax=Kordiimonas sediminis TaxID=1735581 RepID=A0A919E695_9PROT|nr:hypothetical protein [Kordiimonas sediminis]GHF18256.1 hypothetical protein GCM10017044_10960 [Kordiimonas sediminis]